MDVDGKAWEVCLPYLTPPFSNIAGIVNNQIIKTIEKILLVEETSAAVLKLKGHTSVDNATLLMPLGPFPQLLLS